MNILAVGAHPDDVEINCGGTLAKYAALGHKVFIATATNGNIGSATLPKEEIAVIRKREAAQSASIIGAEYICLDYDDELFYEDLSVRINFINLVRHCEADVILTHNPHDYNPDHMLTSKIINDIQVMIPIEKIKTPEKPCKKLPVIYFFEPDKGMGFIPTDYVDITEHFETKKKMFLCHKSQQEWMADNYEGFSTEDTFTSDMIIQSAYRGMQCGVKYAEAFIRCNDAYRMTPQRLLP
ncbi:MAG: PIG-L family deacetylase [Ruminococcaceae bacterium]|nr:PIG-L family deacetylase [Oscillospiraceae bacterium]